MNIHIELPYCLQRLDDGRYILLNRDYKPIGIETKEWVRYEDYPSAHYFGNIVEDLAIALSSDPKSPNIYLIHLYGVKTNPARSVKNLEDYIRRLKLLL